MKGKTLFNLLMSFAVGFLMLGLILLIVEVGLYGGTFPLEKLNYFILLSFGMTVIFVFVGCLVDVWTHEKEIKKEERKVVLKSKFNLNQKVWVVEASGKRVYTMIVTTIVFDVEGLSTEGKAPCVYRLIREDGHVEYSTGENMFSKLNQALEYQRKLAFGKGDGYEVL